MSHNITDKEQSVLKEIFKGFKPKPKSDALAFSKKYGYLSPENSSATGRFIPFPFQELPLKATSDDRIELLVFVKSTRTGYTKTLNFAIAYHIAEYPSPQMIFLPNDTKAREWAKKELKPLLRDMPIVDEKIYKNREDNVLLYKAYAGGFLGIAGLQTENNAASVTLRIVMVDEADRVPVDLGGEGDTFGLLKKRMESFYDGKLIAGSTPTIKGHSNIETLFEETDMRFRYYPCPHCGYFQILEFKNLRWDQEYREGVKTHLTNTAGFKCIGCEEKFYKKDHKKIDKIARWQQTQKFFCCGEWQDPKINKNWFFDEKITIDSDDYLKNGEALCIHCNLTAEYNREDRIKLGVHMWSAMGYQAQSTWIKIAEAFVKSIGSVEKMKVFHNTWLGEPFEEKSVKLETSDLMEKAEEYETVPDGSKIVLMTVDTQDTWVEWLITSWSPGETSHNIKTGKIMGDPVNQFVWDELLKIKRTELKTESGKPVKVYKGFIDMAGHRTDEVKKFVKKCKNDFVMLKGDPKEMKENDARPVSMIKKSSVDDSLIMWVSTSKAKDIVFQRLALQSTEEGFIHHNKSFSNEWFEQLTSEKKVFKKNKRGFIEETYMKQRDRNEALDLVVYQLAAIRLIQAQIKGFDLSIK